MSKGVITKEIAEQFIADEFSVDLFEFTKIDDAAAESLSKCKGHLHLYGLTELSDSAAQYLAKIHRGKIVLVDEIEQIVEGYREDKVLTKEIAEQFIADEDSVNLIDFTELDDAAAESLSKYKGYLDLCGLQKISDVAAESLSKLQVDAIGLERLVSISDQAAKSLSKFKGSINLGVKSLSDDAAESLSKSKICFTRLTSLSETALNSFAKNKQINGIEFDTSNGDINASALQRILHYKIYCPELILDKSVAEKYVSDYSINLNNYYVIDREAAEILANDGSSFQANGIEILSDEIAEILSNPQKNLEDAELVLCGAQCSNRAVESLSKFHGNLYLGFSKLSTQAAKFLSKFQGELLCLPNIDDLNQDASIELAKVAPSKINLSKFAEKKIDKFRKNPVRLISRWGKLFS